MGDRSWLRLILPVLLVLGLIAAPPPGDLRAQALPLVVIDAGHGGVDPGARGPAGTREKDIALEVARELAARLNERGGVEVRMTREADILVPLAERARMANRWRDEGGSGRRALFVSIHANAHEARSVRGFETYFLSEALTEDARRVAAFENSAQRFENGALADDALGFIFNDLRQNHYLRASSEGASIVQRRLAGAQAGPDRGVKQAAFVVLEGAFMPAVLVELGFISNPQEERLLASREYQRDAARRLAAAVGDIFGLEGR